MSFWVAFGTSLLQLKIDVATFEKMSTFLRLFDTTTKTRRVRVRLASCINKIKFFSDQMA